MSQVDKLSILGIRSFDTQLSEVIQFFTPLTLIVGTNGSGKTTIIECLKFMSTGEMPPGAKTGGAFIHDPKLCGEREVHAQVKLGFNNTAGNRMVATRSLLLTVKKNSRTTKSLESNLVRYRNGERDSVSNRMTEIGDLVPKYLGVSKAILEYVIFCHQDDSLWPLSEPGELKKRFDRIFEALKYTKAVENLKALRKNYNIELGKLKIYEETAKQTKDRGEQARRKTDQLMDQIIDLKANKDDYDNKIQAAQTKFNDTWSKVNHLSGIVGELNGKRIEQKSTREVVERLHRNLKHYKESDEELQTMLDQHQDRMAVLSDSANAQRVHHDDLAAKSKAAKGTLVQRERAVGAAEAGQTNHEQQLLQRETLIKQTARHHGIRGYDLDDIGDSDVIGFTERLGHMIRDQKQTVETTRSKSRLELQEAQSDLNGIHQLQSTLTMRKDAVRSNLTVNDEKMTSRQGLLDKVDVDEGVKASLESAVEQTKSRLDKSRTVLDNGALQRAIKEIEGDLASIDNDKEQLDSELVEATKRAGDSARLDYSQKELKDKKKALDQMASSHGKSFKQHVKEDWTVTSLEVDYQAAMDRCSSELASVERQRDTASREAEQVGYKLRTCRKDLKSKRDESQKAAQAIEAATGVKPAEFSERLQELENEHEIAQSDLNQNKKLKAYYETCIQTAQKYSCCRLCTRGFDDQKATDDFLATLRKLTARFDETDAQQTAEDVEVELNMFKKVKTEHDAWKRLEATEIPMLKKQESSLAAQHDQLTAELERHDLAVSEQAEAKRDVQAISKAVQTTVKYHGDSEALDSQIGELKVKQEQNGLSRGLEQIQDDLKAINERSRKSKLALSKAAKQRDDATNSRNALELELRDNQASLASTEHQLKEKASLTLQLEELKAASGKLRDESRQVESEIRDLRPRMMQAQSSYDDIARRGEEKDREQQRLLSELNASMNKLELGNRAIDEYIKGRGPQRLAEAKAALQEINGHIAELDKASEESSREIEYINDQLRNVDETKRTIMDNQDFRKNQKASEKIKEQIAELESHNAESEKAVLDRQAAKLQNERNRLTAEQSVVIGEMKSKDSQLEGLMEDFKTLYKNADHEYKEAHIKVEATKATIEDLGRYAGALDKAIMAFHSKKMEQINSIIAELWQQTYQGTDVDTILIRSDNENVKGNKTYNYRVCMVKQDAEMDMRGRCSAGQKVLASIIIRLALAECFGINCGLIALDEPTTNLDQDNIRALAQSLAEIIRVRRQQRNFQLIVITHDEEFLRNMQCSDFTDYYYRVSRNDKQKSIIEKQDVGQVMN